MLLLILSLVCLGSWVNTFKVAKWRFELYYLDFALGALALAIVAAFTLGTLGSELSFNDRIAVAGLRSQAFALTSGFLFGIGNLLLVAAVSLIGITISFPLALSLAFLIGAYFEGTGSLLLFWGGAVLLVVASVSAGAAARLRSAPKPGASSQASKARRSRAAKGIVVGILAGLMIGLSSPLAASSFWGDLGLGAYAGMLMFVIGSCISTIAFDLVLMNVSLEGARVTFGTYLAGSLRQHLFGISGGLVWGIGVLTGLLAQSTPNSELPAASVLTVFAQGAVLLNMLWGLTVWKELAVAPRARIWSLISLLCFAVALALMASRMPA